MAASHTPPNRGLLGDLSFVTDAIPECRGNLPTYEVADVNCGPSYGDNYSDVMKRRRETPEYVERSRRARTVLSNKDPAFKKLVRPFQLPTGA